MKKNKTKVFNVRLNENEVWLLESIANSLNTDMSKAIIKSLMLTQSYLMKGNNWKPILTQKQINENNERDVEFKNKYGIDRVDAVEILNLDWLNE